MAFLLKDIVLDSSRLPVNWHERTVEIATEKLGVPVSRISGAEILSSSIDSRRRIPEILLTMRVYGKDLPETPDEEFAAFAPVPPHIPDKIALKHPKVILLFSQHFSNHYHNISYL